MKSYALRIHPSKSEILSSAQPSETISSREMNAHRNHCAISALCSALALLAVIATTTGSASAQTVKVSIQNVPPTGGDPPGGLCFELLNAIGKKYGWQVEFTTVGALAARLEGVANSSVDVMCSGTVITNQRRNMGLAFTSPFFSNSEALFVRADDTTPYTSLAELKGKKVAGQKGSVFLQALKAGGLPELTVDSNDAGLSGVASGEIDAFVSGVANRYQTDIANSVPGVRSVETYVPIVLQPAGLVVRNTNTELLGQLQAALEGMKADGTLEAMLAEWHLPPPQF